MSRVSKILANREDGLVQSAVVVVVVVIGGSSGADGVVVIGTGPALVGTVFVALDESRVCVCVVGLLLEVVVGIIGLATTTSVPPTPTPTTTTGVVGLLLSWVVWVVFDRVPWLPARISLEGAAAADFGSRRRCFGLYALGSNF
jgi:hypothetical protein